MTEALDYAVAQAPAREADWPQSELPPVEVLLSGGGDARVLRDPATGRNQYGCAFAPEDGIADFASSTA